MAEVTGTSNAAHRVGHDGIGPGCPVSCLGVLTVGDLLRLLVEAGRAAGRHAGSTAVGGLHACDRVGLGCPVECLGLSAQVVNALRAHRGRAVRVGDVLGLLRSGELAEVRNIGPRRVGEVRTALVAAGFLVPPPGR